MKITRYAGIEDARGRYLFQVDRIAAETRQQHFTKDPGQAMSYERKEAQARAYQAGDSGPFPWIDKQAARTGENKQDITDAIIAQADAWDEAAASIEAERMAAKQVIRSADTTRAMHDALQSMKQAVETVAGNLANS